MTPKNSGNSSKNTTLRHEKRFLSKREVADTLDRSKRQVDRYAKEEQWRYCYKQGPTNRKEKFYHVEDVETKLAELEAEKAAELSGEPAAEELVKALQQELEEIRSLKEELRHLQEIKEVKEGLYREIDELRALRREGGVAGEEVRQLQELVSDLAAKVDEKKDSSDATSTEDVAELKKKVEELREKVERREDTLAEEKEASREVEESPLIADLPGKDELSVPDRDSELLADSVSPPKGEATKSSSSPSHVPHEPYLSGGAASSSYVLSPPPVEEKEELEVIESPITPSSELAYDYLEQVYREHSYRRGMVVRATLFVIQYIWISVMRVGLEIYQSAAMIWYWLQGYFKRGYYYRSKKPEKGQWAVRQMWDMVKFLFWLIPAIVLIRHGKTEAGLVYFFGYFAFHLILRGGLSFLKIRVSLLPTAWYEIKVDDYRFHRPFIDLLRMSAFLGPALYLFFNRQFLWSLAYVLGYLGLHFICNNIGQKFGRDFGLLPQPERSVGGEK